MIPEEIKLPGTVTGAKLITDRRGSRLWRITLADERTLALKYATGAAASLALREEAVMRRLGMAGLIHSSGATIDGIWFASTWHDSPTIHQVWQGARKGDGPHERATAIEATHKAAACLRVLHRIGWRHADLQSAHILCPQIGPAQLLDYALAQGPDDPDDIKPPVIYRGGLAHLAAPEVAAEILATAEDHHVTVSTAAEIYTLGAILHTAWTGAWPTRYDTTAPTAADIYQAVTEPGRRQQLPQGWPRMAEAISAMMSPDPAHRPTAADVVGLMTSMT